ncbi:RING-type domain-containing protein, partial [Aphis craccivora]
MVHDVNANQDQQIVPNNMAVQQIKLNPEFEHLSQAIRRVRGQSTVYIDERGYNYYHHSIRRDIRYLTCLYRRYGCPFSAHMQIEAGTCINISATHPQHTHEPAPRYAVAYQNIVNRLRERAVTENTVAQIIVDQEMLQYPEAEMDLGRPAAIRIIARARLRVSPPIPETLRAWVGVLTSEEWSPRLQINFNGQMVPFFQGPLEILHTENSIEFVGIVFANVGFLNESAPHIHSVNTVCMDGTFQVRPQQPPDIDQLFTIQIIINNVAIPIVHALLVNRWTETYCRLLQFLRNDLNLNITFNNLQIITDFEQVLRNAITKVIPEANNSGCWFHFIQAIIRFVRSHQLTHICTVN